jgi:hypothetical protein
LRLTHRDRPDAQHRPACARFTLLHWVHLRWLLSGWIREHLC